MRFGLLMGYELMEKVVVEGDSWVSVDVIYKDSKKKVLKKSNEYFKSKEKYGTDKISIFLGERSGEYTIGVYESRIHISIYEKAVDTCMESIVYYLKCVSSNTDELTIITSSEKACDLLNNLGLSAQYRKMGLSAR